MSNVTQVLHRHHAHCDEHFAAAEEAALAGNWGECRSSFAQFRGGMEAHFAAEEGILFPSFEATTGMSGGPTQVMRVEHAQMRDLIAQIAAALDSEDSGAYGAAADTLLILLQQHNAKEENILYPMCDDALSNQAAEIGPRLAQHLGAG